MTTDELYQAARDGKSVCGLCVNPSRPYPAQFVLNMNFHMVNRSLVSLQLYQRGTWKTPRPQKTATEETNDPDKRRPMTCQTN